MIPRLEPRESKGPLLAQLKEALSHTRMTLRLVWRSSPTMTGALLAMTLVGGLVPLGIAYSGKRIVDAVVAHSRTSTLRWVGVELGLVVALAVVQRGLGLVRSLLGARLGIDINVAILEKAQGLDLRFFEDPEFYDKLTRARREASSRPISLVTESFSLVQSVITLVGYAVLLVQFSGWAVAMLCIATVPATVAEMRYSKLAFKIRNWRSPESRRILYLEYVLANDEQDRALYVRRATWTQLLSLVGTGTFYGAYAAMAVMAAAGKLTLGNMTMYVLAFRQGQQAFQSALGGIGSMYEHNLYMSNLWEYLGIASATSTETSTTTTTTTSTTTTTANPTPTSTAIQFEGVGFRYPGKTEWALRHIDLTIPSGESLALVGQNGAGKTTFVKLLTRLYEPTEGRIVFGGRDLRDWDPDLLRQRFGVLFQDYNQYQLKVRENVGLGSVDHLDDLTRISRAVDRGGASDVVLALSGGLEAPLGRWFQGGTELSGGQWQKIALARAFMREEAEVLVLDEPTAALDAEAEHAVFERFRALAHGRTTIVISHRFPTVRMARKIIVLDQGQIVESGTHDELVARAGKYARMFALQAEGYK